MQKNIVTSFFYGLIFISMALGAQASELLIGTATVDITPRLPVGLDGQMSSRVATKVESPVTANVVVLESCQDNHSLDVAVMVSCDLIQITPKILEMTRREVQERLPDLDTKKIFLSATHTHTAPSIRPGLFEFSKGVLLPKEYQKIIADRVAEAIEKAWKSRRPGGVSWGLGHAAVAYNRRMVYDDGSAKMYGQTGGNNFRRVEGPEDHGIEVLFFWDKNKKLIATAVNVACPSQEVEARKTVNADFWHEARENLQRKYGKDLCVLAWTGAAGDQSPHLQWRKKAEERMRKLRGLTRLEEIARRITNAVDEAHDVAKLDIRYENVPLVHVTEDIKLPARIVGDEEYAKIKANLAAFKKDMSKEQMKHFQRRVKWYQAALDRYESQKANQLYDMELHVVRLGDVVIATNPFELYTDYGIQMKARSKALQTFVIQLTGPGSYLPTAEAVRGGSYSATVESNRVGPEGGQILVDRTVKEIEKIWKSNKK
jgi:hypothetical protein